MEDVQKIDAVVYLQGVINKATKAGVFETASEAAMSQQCLVSISNRLEELTKENELLKKTSE